MRVLFVFQNYRNSYTGIAKSISTAFETVVDDYKAFEIEPFSYDNRINRVINRLPFVPNAWFQSQNKKLVKQVKEWKPGLVFVLKGTDLYPGTLKQLKALPHQPLLACYNPDDPFNPAACKENVRQCIPYYDHYFIWTHQLMDKIRQQGAGKAHYLPFATDTSIIYPVLADYQYDISFVGNHDQEREYWIYGLVDELEKNSAAYKLRVFGTGWKPYKLLEVSGQVNGQDYLKTIAATRINLNILRKQNKNATNMKTFEIPAARGFLLHENSTEARQIFTEDVAAAYFSDFNDLFGKIHHYLSNEEKRRSLVENGYQTALQEKNTYKERVATALATIRDKR